MFDFFEQISKEKGYSAIRIYTDDEFDSSINLYMKKGIIKEYYSNELETEEINNSTIIFSKSLTFEKNRKWNNRFLQLTAQVEKEK